jgi:hypothetical protein
MTAQQTYRTALAQGIFPSSSAARAPDFKPRVRSRRGRL